MTNRNRALALLNNYKRRRDEVGDQQAFDELHDAIERALDAVAVSDEVRFYVHYERLALDGHCDAPEGAEYDRVKREWLAAGKPEIEPFIRERANVGPW